MTEEEKELLLKDLCARLPYGLWIDDGYALAIHIDYSDVHFENYFNGILNGDVKPYLRPMSSMTEKEKHKLLKFGAVTCLENGEVVDVSCVGFERHADIQDYLNACHFDYRGLIEKGIALEAPEDMYNTDAN